MKTCSKCGTTKPLTDFHKEAKGKHGRQAQCRPCKLTYVKAHRAANPAYARENNYKVKYGITIADYDRLLEGQGGRCAITTCRTDNPGRWDRFDVDHDHATGLIRGLLCNKCNRGIGSLGDDIAGLTAALNYLNTATQPAS